MSTVNDCFEIQENKQHLFKKGNSDVIIYITNINQKRINSIFSTYKKKNNILILTENNVTMRRERTFVWLIFGGLLMQKQEGITNNKLLITQQEMVLIKNSFETKKNDIYGNLMDCLDGYNRLSRRELEQNAAFDKKARVTLLSVENKKTMMTNIMKEWYSVKVCDISDTKMNCQLCGRLNKYIFYIHNKITKVDLHIGSECVKKFPSIIGIQQERKKLSEIQRENDRRKRKVQFEILEGEDLGFLEEAENRFKNFKVMLPYELHYEIKDIIYQLNFLKTSYVNSGGNLDEAFQRYSSLKETIHALFQKAESHQEKTKDLLLACDRETSVWLLDTDSKVWEAVAKNEGIFNVETLKKIYYKDFVVRMLPEISKHLLDKDIRILEVNGSKIVFSIKNNRYYYPIKFSVSIKEFMETIGCYCLTDSTYHFFKDDIKEVSIENTKKNFEAVYNSFSPILKKAGYDFEIEDKTEQAYWKKLPYNETEKRWIRNDRQVEAMYKKADIGLFLRVVSPFLLKQEKVFEDNMQMVIKKMERGKIWITQNEKDINEQIAREARGLQKQREFIPY